VPARPARRETRGADRTGAWQELRRDVAGALETYEEALGYDPRHVASLNSKG